VSIGRRTLRRAVRFRQDCGTAHIFPDITGNFNGAAGFWYRRAGARTRLSLMNRNSA